MKATPNEWLRYNTYVLIIAMKVIGDQCPARLHGILKLILFSERQILGGGEF